MEIFNLKKMFVKFLAGLMDFSDYVTQIFSKKWFVISLKSEIIQK